MSRVVVAVEPPPDAGDSLEEILGKRIPIGTVHSNAE